MSADARRADAERASVVLVDNVSVEPFRLLAPSFGVAVPCDLAPSQAWTLAAGGSLDLAVIPVVKASELAAVMEPIGDFGVACRGPVGSVLLFGSVPLAELIERRLPILPTTRSETSRRLLRLLCRREFGTEPVYTADATRAQGWLYIGDEALRQCQDPGGPPVVGDLCDWWERLTGQPFVFARWMVRRSAGVEFKRSALRWLDDCATLARTAAGRETMAVRALDRGLFTDRNAALAYFDALRSRFDADDLRGEALFLREWARLEAA